MKKIITLITLLTVAFVSANPLLADVVYITARPSPTGGGANLDGTYSENLTLGDTSAKSVASGVKASSGSRYYASSTSLTNTASGVDLTPTLAVPAGVYQIDYTQNPNAGNVTTNGIFSVSATGGTLNFSETDKFQRGAGRSAVHPFCRQHHGGVLRFGQTCSHTVDRSGPSAIHRHADRLTATHTPRRWLGVWE